MFPSLRLLTQASLPSLPPSTTPHPSNSIYTNPYKAKRLWPPDFSKLSPKHQFRLERRYKRRAKLRWARPGWTKGVKIVQGGVVSFIAVYGVLFLDWNSRDTRGKEPFQDVREWFFGMTGNIWTRDQVRKREERVVVDPIANVGK